MKHWYLLGIGIAVLLIIIAWLMLGVRNNKLQSKDIFNAYFFKEFQAVDFLIHEVLMKLKNQKR
jgi:hypothetical protein